jgi:hypothetical protein
MISEKEVLNSLDYSYDGYYCEFVQLGHGYSYLIDSRINLFRNDHDKWAIAIERLGYNPRAGAITLQIYYFGNCLINLEQYNNRNTNTYEVMPIDWDSFQAACSDSESLKSDIESLTIRGKQIKVSHNKEDYKKAGIELNEYEPGEIRMEEVGRLLVTQYGGLFRATDGELYKSIPKDLNKILVIDEWYHKDYYMMLNPTMSQEQLIQTYEFNKQLTGLAGMDLTTFIDTFRQQEIRNNHMNREEWENNRPSSYETWQQIAKVIALGDTSIYKPTVKPNTHWSNYPDSGSL